MILTLLSDATPMPLPTVPGEPGGFSPNVTALNSTVIQTYATRIEGDVLNNWPQIVPFLLVFLLVKLLPYVLDLRAKRKMPEQLTLFGG